MSYVLVFVLFWDQTGLERGGVSMLKLNTYENYESCYAAERAAQREYTTGGYSDDFEKETFYRCIPNPD